jgi:hypothetical protein
MRVDGVAIVGLREEAAVGTLGGGVVVPEPGERGQAEESASVVRVAGDPCAQACADPRGAVALHGQGCGPNDRAGVFCLRCRLRDGRRQCEQAEQVEHVNLGIGTSDHDMELQSGGPSRRLEMVWAPTRINRCRALSLSLGSIGEVLQL